MSIDATTATAPTTQSLSLQNFMQILLTQLQYQDPLKPMDNQQFMAQMAQFTSLEQTQQMNDKLTTLISNQAALQSVGLIGRTVDFQSSGGATVSGQVISINLGGTSPQIAVNTGSGTPVSIALSQLADVR